MGDGDKDHLSVPWPKSWNEGPFQKVRPLVALDLDGAGNMQSISPQLAREKQMIINYLRSAIPREGPPLTRDE
jgi:hypothetical protein